MSNTVLRGEGWKITPSAHVADCGCVDEKRTFCYREGIRPVTKLSATGMTAESADRRLAAQLRAVARAATEAAGALERGER